ncbi:MAG: hypothetical protein EA382_05880 [Spirochaetaceae bacterium]|nr:MAG: hypothetical protein EA382_05880 [Spirochaetaceae bacterium]
MEAVGDDGKRRGRFGSVVRDPLPSSVGDIDFAVAGLPPERFYHTYGAMLMALSMPFDLVDLDDDSPFVQALRTEGSLERVA